VLRHPNYTRDRLRDLAKTIDALVYPATCAVADLAVSPRVDRISFEAAERLDYRPVKLGEAFGPLWSTFWFRGSARVPPEWGGRRVDLRAAARGRARRRRRRLGRRHLRRRPGALVRRAATAGRAQRDRHEEKCKRPPHRRIVSGLTYAGTRR